MKKTIFLTLTAAVIIPLLILSCGMGLEPAKSGETSVSLSFASLLGFEPMASSGRAIFPDGGGSLYIMMEGAAERVDYYGPYTVSKSGSATITITDIPAGRYDAMTLLYTPVKGLEGEPSEIFALIDLEEGNELFILRSSVGTVSNCLIKEGRKNSFPVTMSPITLTEVIPSNNSFPLYVAQATNFNGFIKLSGLAEPFADIAKMALLLPGFSALNKQVKTEIYNNGQSEMNLKNIAFYDGGGKLITMPPFSSVTVAIEGKKTFDVPYTAGDKMFMYLDVSEGGPKISVEATIGNLVGFTPITATLDISAHSDTFDTIESVIFSEKHPINDPPSIVGVALAKGGEDYIYSLTGYVNTTWLDKDLYLTIKGTKYGVLVEYVTDAKYTVNEGESIVIEDIDSLTPLLHYVVLESAMGYFNSHVGKTGTLTITPYGGGQSFEKTGTIVKVASDLSDIGSYTSSPYCAIIPIDQIPPLTDDELYTFDFLGPWDPKTWDVYF